MHAVILESVHYDSAGHTLDIQMREGGVHRFRHATREVLATVLHAGPDGESVLAELIRILGEPERIGQAVPVGS